MIFCYAHKPGPYSAIIREAFLQQRIDSKSDIKQRVRDSETHSSKWDVCIKSLPLDLREPLRRGGKKEQETEGREAPRERDIPKQLSKAHMNPQSLQQRAQGLHGSAPGPLHVYCSFQLAFEWDS